ncbi:MAG: D-alanyl-D-alanine carboxypeptidase family protein [Eubacterium sp.]
MKKIVIFILALSLFTALPVKSYAKEEQIKAKSSILMCMDTKEVLLENNAYEHLSPASVTKIMSILLIMEAIDSKQISLKDTVTASENAVSKGGSQIWLEVGEKMTVDELLKAVIIASANDACTLLAEHIAGSDSAFVDKMNERVRELGLENSNFENCTGLDDDTTNHYSCAYDLAVIACEVMKHPLVEKYSTVWLDYLRDGKTELNNTNKLVNKYNGLTGLKTGTTSNAGFCLCATAKRDSLSLVSVVLGAQTSEDRFNLSTQLLNKGFADYKLTKVKIDKNKINTVKVKNGVLKKIKPEYDGNGSILVRKNSGKLTYEYNCKKEVKAPVKKGQVLGEITVKSDGKKVALIQLKAKDNVQIVNFAHIFRKMLINT